MYSNSLWLPIASQRTSGFIVGLTNVAPSVSSPPVIGRYMECGRGPADMPCCTTNQTYYVKCADNQPPARYVIIQLNKTEYLSFCELEVYGQGIYTSKVFSLVHVLNDWGTDTDILQRRHRLYMKNQSNDWTCQIVLFQDYTYYMSWSWKEKWSSKVKSMPQLHSGFV